MGEVMTNGNLTGDQLTMLGMGFLWGSDPIDLILADDHQDGGEVSCVQIVYPGHGSVIMESLYKLADHGNATLEVNMDRGVIFVRGINRRSYFYLGLRRKLVIWMENCKGDVAQAFVEGFDTARSLNLAPSPLSKSKMQMVESLRSQITASESEESSES